jgi:SAM-dependent methyltransferase
MDMASLLINLKFNHELGNRIFKLTCSYGQDLPYEDESFDVIASFQTLEHVGPPQQQVAFLAEASRCLAPGGLGVFTFPNRFDLLRPESHVYIRFLGFVPHRYKNAISLWLRGVPSSDIFPVNAFRILSSLRTIERTTFALHSTSEFSTCGIKGVIARSRLYKWFGPWNVLVAKKAC